MNTGICFNSYLFLTPQNNICIFFLGAYVSLTREGKIVVDGVLTSCHASCYHDLAHIGTIPFQQYPEITALIFGEEDGSPAYVNILREFSRWVLPFDQTK